ncbi:MAG: Maf family protein, partial [Phascolarctobacterium sp.]|nr:Maf family protein [Phascolarctobacterium sp.]
MQVILASASPRRLALLQQIGITAEVCPADFDEVSGAAVQAEDVVLANAIGKCRAVVKIKGDTLPVIAADTVVVAEGVILGKPCDDKDAVKMLQQLSGKTHKVLTGLAV